MSHAMAERALDWARAHPLPNGHVVPMCLWGPRGVGKTAWISSYCLQRGYGLRGYQPSHDHDGTGLTGMPRIDEGTQQVEYAPPPFLPSRILEGTSLQEEQGVIFFDEINRGSVQARNALMEPINEDKISKSGWEAPKGWVSVAAANPPEPGYDVAVIDEALMNRMCHIWVAFDKDSWRGWAVSGDNPLPEAVVSYAYEHSDILATDRADLPDDIMIPCTPRSMEFLGRLYVPGMERDLLQLFAYGLLGKAAAPGFMEHIAQHEAREFHQPQLTTDHILTGQFEGPLAAEMSSGNRGHVIALATELAQRISAHKPTDSHAAAIAKFMKVAGSGVDRAFALALHEGAPQWTESVNGHFRALSAPAES